jgi:hypothetical protein
MVVGAFVRVVGISLVVWAPLSCHAAGCTVGRPGECADDNCCTDDQQPPVAWNLSALAGDKQIPGPQSGPVGKQYLFSLLSNVANVPQICQEHDVIEFNAFEYDITTNKTEDMCKPIGCSIDPLKHTSYDGLHVKSDRGRGLLLEYINLDLGESYLVVNLSCQCDWGRADPSGIGFPENLHQEGDEKWRMTWNTKVVCGSCGTPPPTPPTPEPEPEPEPPTPTPTPPRTPTSPGVPKKGGAGWGTAVVIILVLLAVLGAAGGFVMWKKTGRLPCMKSGSALDEHLDARLDAEPQDWSTSSGDSSAIRGAE